MPEAIAPSIDLTIGRGDNSPAYRWQLNFATLGSDFALTVTTPAVPFGSGPSTTRVLTVSGGDLILDTAANVVTWSVGAAQTAVMPFRSGYKLQRLVPGGEVRAYAYGGLFVADGAVGDAAGTAVVVAGPQGPAGIPGPSGGTGLYNAAVPLSGHRALMFVGDGTVTYADPNAPTYVFAGVSLNAAIAGATVQASLVGQVTEPSWQWTPLAPVFVAPGGLLTQSRPTSGVLHVVGFAPSATTLEIVPTLPTLLAA